MINDVAADDESGNGKNETEATVSKNVTMDVDDDVRKSGDGTSEEESADEGTAVGKGDDPSETILLSESDEELFEPAAKRPKIEELKKRISPRLNPDQSNAVDKNETDNEVMVRIK